MDSSDERGWKDEDVLPALALVMQAHIDDCVTWHELHFADGKVQPGIVIGGQLVAMLFMPPLPAGLPAGVTAQ